MKKQFDQLAKGELFSFVNPEENKKAPVLIKVDSSAGIAIETKTKSLVEPFEAIWTLGAMKCSEFVKWSGLKSLKEFSSLCGVSTRTLLNWFVDNRQAFDCILEGAFVAKTKKEEGREIFAVCTERDTYQPQEDSHPIIFETYLDEADRETAEQRAEYLGRIYGKARVAKIVFVS